MHHHRGQLIQRADPHTLKPRGHLTLGFHHPITAHHGPPTQPDLSTNRPMVRHQQQLGPATNDQHQHNHQLGPHTPLPKDLPVVLSRLPDQPTRHPTAHHHQLLDQVQHLAINDHHQHNDPATPMVRSFSHFLSVYCFVLKFSLKYCNWFKCFLKYLQFQLADLLTNGQLSDPPTSKPRNRLTNSQLLLPIGNLPVLKALPQTVPATTTTTSM